MSNTISIRKGLNIRLVGEATKEIKEIPRNLEIPKISNNPKHYKMF